MRPIKAIGEKRFWFHIDFENLNQEELELLCFSLQPDAMYEHRLGMGKSLGLGSVKIAPQALLLTDRVGRYAHDECDAIRYHAAWTENPPPVTPENPTSLTWIPDRYATCMASITANGYSNPASAADLGASGAVRVPPDVLRAIVITGNPYAVKKPVHTPQLAAGAVIGTRRVGGVEVSILSNGKVEVETFQWFVKNDRTINSSIGAIDRNTTALPALKRDQP